ncbi:MAG TPA: glycoside hydrolase family 140 protein [Anaerolineae bacterium]|nr:glycoside hydrolase family 140 protein [Anaerolineae bacterium]
MNKPCSTTPAYPLSVSANQRYLVDQHGLPCLIHGDTAWSLISALTREEVEQYLENRQRKGFNAIIVNLIEHKFNGPLNRYGEGPFTTPGDLTAPNEKYFAFADWCIEKAAEHGIQAFLAPLYLGYPHPADDDGWFHEALAAGPARCREYGRYVGQRYGRFDNVVWLMGGDRNPGEALDHVESIVEGIKEYDGGRVRPLRQVSPRHLFTAHTLPEHSPAVEYARGGWLNLNATYTYEIVHRKLLADYNRRPVRPFFLIESTYEGEHNASEVQIRRQAYWAILCGGCGQFIGNRPLWLFDPGWQAALHWPASQDMVHLKALFTSRAWYDLVPDQEHIAITEGLGEFRGLNTLTAARTADGSTVIAYVPTRRTVTADLSQVSGERARGWWFDPRTGKSTSAGEFPTRGCQRLTPPGEGDWVLVLDDASRDLAAPGT